MNLETFTQARGVSGNEGAAREAILEAVRPFIDEHAVDALGNLICHKKPRSGAAAGGVPLKVMVAAHMDEIGLIVTGINADGTLSFDKIGGIDDRVLLSKRVLVGAEAVPGVIGYAPIHLIPRAERDKAPDMSKAVIDIGATDRGGAERCVSVGDYVSFVGDWTVLDTGDLRTVMAKALDDRAGCALLAELLQDDYAVDLYAVFTAQEEVGTRGARVAAHRIAPDVAIALEGTICDDLPKPPEDDNTPVTVLGNGPAITFMDRSFIADRRLVSLLLRLADEQGIPHQFKSAVAGGTDAGAMHLAHEGVPSVTVAVPVRYIHAPISMLSLNDFDHTVQLVRAALHALEGRAAVMKEMIKRLVEAYGPSGREEGIAAVIQELVRPFVDELRTDALGNVIALKRGTGGGQPVMVAAHMDEIGLIVTWVDDKGFLRFAPTGGVSPVTLMGGRVRFANGTLGVIGWEKWLRPDAGKSRPELEEMYIDVGATHKEDCPVGVGDAAGFVRPFEDLGDRMVAKSMDDRIACAVAIQALMEIESTPNDVYVVFTTQEEVGTRGALTAAYGIEPAVGIAVDVTNVGDTPKARPMAVSLGAGPAIKVMDSGMLAHPGVVRWMVATAEAQGIAYQREVLLGGSTDARAIQTSRAGVPAGCISIPCRYVHTPSEMVDTGDVQDAVRLLTALLSGPIVL